jgi:HK97 family phage major capsid protein
MDEILAQIAAVLGNPEATIEEMAAVLTAVQEALTASTADDATPVDEAQLIETVKQLKNLEAKMNLKKAAIDAKTEVKNMAIRNSQPVNALPNSTVEVKASRTRTSVFESDEAAHKSGLFLAAINGNKSAEKRYNDKYGEIKTLTSANSASAGILVPEEMESAIVKLREERGVARQLAQVVNMGSETRNILKEVSGQTAYFITEGSEITDTDLVYRSLTLSAKLAAVRTKFRQTLSDDAMVDIADEITNFAAYKLADLEDKCYLIGDGTATYGGMLGVSKVWEAQTAANSGTWTTDADKDNNAGILLATGSTWSAITDDDISQLLGKVAAYPGFRGQFVCSAQFYYEVMHRLAINAGGTTATEIINGVARPVFYGIPVVFSQVMPQTTAVSTVPLIYGDFAQGSYFGDRKGITIETDKNIGTQVNDVVITERFDVNVHDYGNYNATAASQTRGALAGLALKNS